MYLSRHLNACFKTCVPINDLENKNTFSEFYVYTKPDILTPQRTIQSSHFPCLKKQLMVHDRMETPTKKKIIIVSSYSHVEVEEMMWSTRVQYIVQGQKLFFSVICVKY